MNAKAQPPEKPSKRARWVRREFLHPLMPSQAAMSPQTQKTFILEGIGKITVNAEPQRNNLVVQAAKANLRRTISNAVLDRELLAEDRRQSAILASAKASAQRLDKAITEAQEQLSGPSQQAIDRMNAYLAR